MNYSYQVCFMAAIAFANTGCGGGGPQTGECLFPASSACNPTINSGASTSAPITLPVTQPTLIPIQPVFTQSGLGDTQFALPKTLSIISVNADFTGISSNFILYADSDLIVNEVIGTSQPNAAIQGTYVVTAGATIRITSSNGVFWKISSGSPAPPSAATLTLSGTGDQVFYLPARTSAYRIRASYPSTSQNFIVYANDMLVVNEIIGSSNTPHSYDGIISMPASARIEIRGSVGVIWNLGEIR